MYKSWDSSFLQQLVETPNYRAFLAEFFRSHRSPRVAKEVKSPKALSLSEFSLRAGFRSRAYIRDIMVGTKRVQASNFDRVCHGLRLSGTLKEYFRQLVALEEGSVLLGKGTSKSAEAQLDRLRKRIIGTIRAQEVMASPLSRAKALAVDAPLVFAASGDLKTGASFEEIQARTRLNDAKLKEILESLIQTGAMTESEGRFIPVNLHLALSDLGNETSYREDYQRALNTCARRFPAQVTSGRALFFTSTVCVSQHDLPRLKEALRRTMLEFVESAENPAGDAVSEIVVGFTSNR